MTIKEEAICDWLAPKDIAQLLNLSQPTVSRLIKEKELPAFKIRGTYRIKKVDFERWLEGCRIS